MKNLNLVVNSSFVLLIARLGVFCFRVLVFVFCVAVGFGVISVVGVHHIRPRALVLAIQQSLEDGQQVFELDRIFQDGEGTKPQRVSQESINVVLDNRTTSDQHHGGCVLQSLEQFQDP